MNQYKCASPTLLGQEGNTETGRLKDAFEYCVEGQSGEALNSSVLSGSMSNGREEAFGGPILLF